MADAGSLQHRIISPSTIQLPFRAPHIPPAVNSGGRTYEEYRVPAQYACLVSHVLITPAT